MRGGQEQRSAPACMWEEMESQGQTLLLHQHRPVALAVSALTGMHVYLRHAGYPANACKC